MAASGAAVSCGEWRDDQASRARAHAFGDVTPTMLLAFRDGGTRFTIAGVPIARNSLVAEAGLELALSGKVSLGPSPPRGG
jgi:uncharacterized protein with beta-barrel porin domain